MNNINGKSEWNYNLGFCAIQSVVALLQYLWLQTSVRPTFKYGVYINALLVWFIHIKPFLSDPSSLNPTGNDSVPFIQATFVWHEASLVLCKCTELVELLATLQSWGCLIKLKSMVIIRIVNEQIQLTKYVSISVAHSFLYACVFCLFLLSIAMTFSYVY